MRIRLAISAILSTVDNTDLQPRPFSQALSRLSERFSHVRWFVAHDGIKINPELLPHAKGRPHSRRGSYRARPSWRSCGLEAWGYGGGDRLSIRVGAVS
jgi:hypothetical protein